LSFFLKNKARFSFWFRDLAQGMGSSLTRMRCLVDFARQPCFFSGELAAASAS
jgi:hypothetical protein